jgi:aminoglycoside phosphotransferase
MEETPLRVGRLMGRVLRDLHALDPSGCPGWQSPDDLLVRAERNVADGRIPARDLGSGEAKTLLKKLMRRPPAAFDPVVCHGDFCLPNVLAKLDDSCGLIDLGAVSVADRHLDLAAAVRSLRFNGGLEDAVRVFTNWYGPDDIDPQRLAFYTDLCELA